jgi:hypothetical protein
VWWCECVPIQIVSLRVHPGGSVTLVANLFRDSACGPIADEPNPAQCSFCSDLLSPSRSSPRSVAVRDNRLFEPQREGRPGHAGTLPQLLDSPIICRPSCIDVIAALICLSDRSKSDPTLPLKPSADADANPEPASCRRVVVRPENRPAEDCELLPHPFQAPAHRRLVRFFRICDELQALDLPNTLE